MSIPKHYIDKREREHIFQLQNLAICKYGSIRGLARACNMNRKIMDRVQMNGIYSLTSFSALKLCYALHITPNQLYGFEPLPEFSYQEEIPKPIKLNTLSYRQVHERLNAALFGKSNRLKGIQ
ncbi:MAG: hypothetical protein K2M95_00985 [Clostridiales bacterium]|nr:hypothetical protein [Clostridiales bacterium]